MSDAKANLIKITIFTLLAYIFSIGCRYYWVYWAGDFTPFMFNGQVMINTNDGYAFAEGARDLIAGFHQPNDLSYVHSALSQLTAFFARILPFEFETIILFMSSFLSSLIVVPIILIGHELKCTTGAFIGALVACVANSYYNRTMAGYYDTDMLNIVLAVFNLWAIIRIIVRKDRNSLIFVPLCFLAYIWWYPSSYSVNVGFLGIFTLYTLIFERKCKILYEALILITITITWMKFAYKIPLLAILTAFFYFDKGNLKWNLLIAIGVATIFWFIYCGGVMPIWYQLRSYIFRSVADDAVSNLRYFNVNQTVRESGEIPLETVIKRISSHVAVFCVACVGYIFMCYKHKEFLISLPIVIFGFLALKAGLRFTIYTVPVFGLAFGFMVWYVVSLLKLNKFLSSLILAGITALAVYPSLRHIYDYKVPTVFFNNEVAVLDELKSIADREDYVISWWDFGYPIRYYSDVKTLVDGGKHRGSDNYPVSYALFKEQTNSANMSRIAVEYTEKGFAENNQSTIMGRILAGYNEKDVDDFLVKLDLDELKIPAKSREIYYFLPEKMLEIFPVVIKFSNLDLKTGESYREPFYLYTAVRGKSERGFVLDGGLEMSSDVSVLYADGAQVPVKEYFEISYKGGKLAGTRNARGEDGVYVVYLVDSGRIVLMDETVFKSTYIQLFLFENYDNRLFEPVILTQNAKIYRLKK